MKGRTDGFRQIVENLGHGNDNPEIRRRTGKGRAEFLRNTLTNLSHSDFNTPGGQLPGDQLQRERDPDRFRNIFGSKAQLCWFGVPQDRTETQFHHGRR